MYNLAESFVSKFYAFDPALTTFFINIITN